MMTTTKKLAIGISAIALTVTGIAYAQGADTKPKFDADGDGVITRVEAQKAADEMFARMDVNKDGKLDKADREARREAMRTKMFEKLDANSDGSISKTEFLADKGPDGKGPGGDHPDGPPPPPRGEGPGGPGMGGPDGGPGGPDGPPPPPPGEGPGMAGPGMDGPRGHGKGDHGRRGGRGPGMMMAKAADTNNDGAISKAEFTAAAMKHFAAMDANNDGKVTKEEHEAAHAKMKAERQTKKAEKPASE